MCIWAERAEHAAPTMSVMAFVVATRTDHYFSQVVARDKERVVLAIHSRRATEEIEAALSLFCRAEMSMLTPSKHYKCAQG